MRTDRIGFSAHTTIKVDRKPDLTPQPTLTPADGHSSGAGGASGVGDEAIGPIGYGTARGESVVAAVGSSLVAATGASGGLSDALGGAGEVYVASASGIGNALAEGRYVTRAVGLAFGNSTPVASGTGRWEVKGFAAGAGDAVATGSGSQTLLLNHFDGPPGTTTFTDERAGVVWQTIGSPSIQNFPKFGDGALYTDYYTSYARAYGFTSPHLGSWTIEGWGWLQDGNTPPVLSLILGEFEESNSYAEIRMDTRIQGPFPYQKYLVGKAFDQSRTVTIVDVAVPMSGFSFGTYYHFAFVRDKAAGTYAGYWNGYLLFLVSSSLDIGYSPVLTVRDGGVYISGAAAVDEVRISPMARYSGAIYTVPTGPFTLD